MAHTHLHVLSALCVAVGTRAEDYLKVASLTLPWAKQLPLPDGVAPGDLAAVADACAAAAACDAYDSHGVMYACEGRCTCETSGATCPEATDGVDLFVKPVGTPPLEWAEEVRAANALHSTYPASQPRCFNAAVANGYLGTTVGWDAMYVQGLFNGACGTIRKARLPSFLLITIPSAEAVASKLDLQAATHTTKWALPGGAVVYQTLLANRAHRHCYQMEFWSTADVVVPLHQDLDFNASGARPGNGCSGGFTDDFEFTLRGQAGRTVVMGRTKIPFDDGRRFNVTLVQSAIPVQLSLHPGRRVSIATCMATDVDGDALSAAQDGYDAVTADPTGAAAAHEAAWAALWEAGVEVAVANGTGGNETAEMMLNGMGLGFNTSFQLQAKVNASLYNVYSTVRDDWHAGASPGGIQSGSYQGAVFFDMEMYLLQSMLLLQPELALSMLKYREASLPTARKIAALFGYRGAMFPWTAAYQGSAFGCCSGHGTLENCLEQHNTPATGVQAWQYYLATGDVAYLNTTGWALLEGIAQWVDSRVRRGPDGATTVPGMLPVDEWCVDSGCGCESGVENDAWTNAAMRVALQGHEGAAAVLGRPPVPRNASSIPVLFDTEQGRHIQFNSTTCPDGVGGQHYTGQHTVCPEDVLYLAYPLRDYMNVSAEVAAADVNFFEPRTCRFNAGMTTPIHTIVMTDLLAAEAAGPEITVARRDAVFYRALHAVQYGPFHTFNEVDTHKNIEGHGSFNNAHFLTGNGGFLQNFVYGFSGLRVTLAGLKISAPLPPATLRAVTLRRLAFHGMAFRVVYTLHNTTLTLLSPSAAACVRDSAGSGQAVAAGAPLALVTRQYRFPGMLTAGAC
eukprot:TRINITY_DN5834_c0_g3_i1.p1 TRINITY_DN5834_c0_g3~~TRINITY_DN5834_c0_g3_i1.p1  ORF type:complete len:863 (+),score=241.18 TRINITY_DN5834_c0_g3_i1:39-2591(+)